MSLGIPSSCAFCKALGTARSDLGTVLTCWELVRCCWAGTGDVEKLPSRRQGEQFRAFSVCRCLCLTILRWVAHLHFYNRDNVEWSEEQEANARSKVQENSSQLLPQDKQGTFRCCSNASVLPVCAAAEQSELCVHLCVFLPSPSPELFEIHYWVRDSENGREGVFLLQIYLYVTFPPSVEARSGGKKMTLVGRSHLGLRFFVRVVYI